MTTEISEDLAPVYVGEKPKCTTRWWNTKTGELDFECQADATHLVTAHSNIGNDHGNRVEPMCERCLNQAMLVWCPIHDCQVVISWFPL